MIDEASTQGFLSQRFGHVGQHRRFWLLRQTLVQILAVRSTLWGASFALRREMHTVILLHTSVRCLGSVPSAFRRYRTSLAAILQTVLIQFVEEVHEKKRHANYLG